ncbi:hypothetical protein BUALT_Bualt01G0230600 [Buddleja alternifolia]|uniref:t-SNARE coiled-coil homology domain-containing protein n=1 Tax=Buddleja alternifolia TaxID=168488 RepID=A0AAV6YF80_9LAMI|nr:hypothetical protein BUALT_Bualt01G0230600 [Buddleja alternifolia]
MSVKNLITRVDAICSKYDKYDVVKHRESNDPLSGDAFIRLYAAVEADLHHLLQDAAEEKNRAAAVAMKAEIRRSKVRLLEELPKLQRFAFKKVKGVSKEELEARSELVSALKHRIEAIPDGSSNATDQISDLAASTPVTGIKFNSNIGLDVVAEGLDTLKNMARDMNEELDRQVPLMDEIDDKVDRATSDIKSTNLRLKDTVTKVKLLICFEKTKFYIFDYSEFTFIRENYVSVEIQP